jgi:hypothetical protein
MLKKKIKMKKIKFKYKNRIETFMKRLKSKTTLKLNQHRK